jgi:hypothetical protein
VCSYNVFRPVKAHRQLSRAHVYVCVCVCVSKKHSLNPSYVFNIIYIYIYIYKLRTLLPFPPRRHIAHTQCFNELTRRRRAKGTRNVFTRSNGKQQQPVVNTRLYMLYICVCIRLTGFIGETYMANFETTRAHPGRHIPFLRSGTLVSRDTRPLRLYVIIIIIIIIIT